MSDTAGYKIEPHLFQDAEHLHYGRQPILDSIFYRWARKAEETLFEKLKLELYCGISTAEEMRFSNFYKSIMSPRPIFLVNNQPSGHDFVITANSNFLSLIIDDTNITDDNYQKVLQIMQELVNNFDQAHAGIANVNSVITKMTTYPFRARIVSAYEPCVVVRVYVSGGDDKSGLLSFCFPLTSLSYLRQNQASKHFLPSLFPQNNAPKSVYAPDKVDYSVRCSIGNISLANMIDSLEKSRAVPLRAKDERIIISLNNKPLFVGRLVEYDGRYAVEITGTLHTGNILNSDVTGLKRITLLNIANLSQG